ncbi:MAG: hypothetical protein ABIL58_15955 [Pseudomonadota bacterium]
MRSILGWVACAIVVSAIGIMAVCYHREVSDEETTFRQGRLYRKLDVKPYTGIVTGIENVPGEPVLKYRKMYVDGFQHGDSNYFFANGNLARTEPYMNGQINGIMTYYYDSGQTCAQIHLVNGERGGRYGEVFFERLK